MTFFSLCYTFFHVLHLLFETRLYEAAGFSIDIPPVSFQRGSPPSTFALFSSSTIGIFFLGRSGVYSSLFFLFFTLYVLCHGMKTTLLSNRDFFGMRC